MKYAAIPGIEQHRVIRQIIGNQQLFTSTTLNQGKSGGIGDRRSARSLAQAERDFFVGRELLRRNLDEALGSNCAIPKAVNRNAIAEIAPLFSSRIGN